MTSVDCKILYNEGIELAIEEIQQLALEVQEHNSKINRQLDCDLVRVLDTEELIQRIRKLKFTLPR